MSSPYSYNSQTGNDWNYNVSSLIGCGYMYKISKRFSFNMDYKALISTSSGSKILSFFLVGSKLQF